MYHINATIYLQVTKTNDANEETIKELIIYDRYGYSLQSKNMLTAKELIDLAKAKCKLPDNAFDIKLLVNGEEVDDTYIVTEPNAAFFATVLGSN